MVVGSGLRSRLCDSEILLVGVVVGVVVFVVGGGGVVAGGAGGAGGGVFFYFFHNPQVLHLHCHRLISFHPVRTQHSPCQPHVSSGVAPIFWDHSDYCTLLITHIISRIISLSDKANVPFDGMNRGHLYHLRFAHGRGRRAGDLATFLPVPALLVLCGAAVAVVLLVPWILTIVGTELLLLLLLLILLLLLLLLSDLVRRRLFLCLPLLSPPFLLRTECLCFGPRQ